MKLTDVFAKIMRTAKSVDFCADLIGPDIRFHHGKVNSKLPGTATQVKWHQDFPFQPMTNNDMVTCLLFIDDVTFDNGPLEVLPGTHKGPIHSHWHDGVFTGAVDAGIEADVRKGALKCTGKAGDACLMHSRLLHGSLPNMTDAARCLYIVTYVAEDAIALDRNPIPHKFDGEIVRGQYTGRVRSTSFEMEMPEYPKEASFFGQQSKVG